MTMMLTMTMMQVEFSPQYFYSQTWYHLVLCSRYLEPTPDRRINIVDARQWEKDTILVCYDDFQRHSDFESKLWEEDTILVCYADQFQQRHSDFESKLWEDDTESVTTINSNSVSLILKFL